MFADKKFKIKGKYDKRGRKTNVTSKENMEKIYDINESEMPMKQLLNASSNEELSATDTDDMTDEEESNIEHNWGEFDADCPEIENSTARLALCNINWEMIVAKDIYNLMESVKPLTGKILSVKVYQSEYGKRMKQIEETQGPFALIQQLQSQKQSHNTLEKSDTDENESEEENVDMEKLRLYQINTMKYAYAIIECDSTQTAEHLYRECNGFEFEKTSNIIDLRFVPNDTQFEPGDILSQMSLEQATSGFNDDCDDLTQIITKVPSKGFIGKNGAGITQTPIMMTENKCLSQTHFDIAWDQTDAKRRALLQSSLLSATLYGLEGGRFDKIGKSRNSNKEKKKLKKQLISQLTNDGIIDGIESQNTSEDTDNTQPDSSSKVKKKTKKAGKAVKKPGASLNLDQFLASPSSAEETDIDQIDTPDTSDKPQDSQPITNAINNVADKYQKYRELLKSALTSNDFNKEGDANNDDFFNQTTLLSESETEEGEKLPLDLVKDPHSHMITGNNPKSKMKKPVNGLKIKSDGSMSMTWNPEDEQGMIESKNNEKNTIITNGKNEQIIDDNSESLLTPWESYLQKDKAKKMAKKLKKMETQRQLDNNTNHSANDINENENCTKSSAHLELLLMDDEDYDLENSSNAIINADSNDNSTHKNAKKWKRKKKIQPAPFMIDKNQNDLMKNPPDQRFQAMYTDPNYAKDPSHPNFQSNKKTAKFQ